VEWQVYFLFPLFVWLWRRLGDARAIALTTLLPYASLLVLRDTHLAALTVQYVALFALGMLAARIAFAPSGAVAAQRDRFPWPLAAGTLAALVGLLCLRWGLREAYAHLPLLDLLVGLFTLCLLAAAARPGPNRLRNALALRPLVFVGTFAYSLYLIHAPLLQLLWQYAIRPLRVGEVTGFALLASAGCPLVVGAAYLFFLGCERPFLSRSSAR